MLVEVTVEHIRRGKRGNPAKCPVALALKEKLHSKTEVGPVSIFRCVNKKGIAGALTPPGAELFIKDFDSGRDVKPFTFEITFHRLKEQKW